jgi:hypothetical protein
MKTKKKSKHRGRKGRVKGLPKARKLRAKRKAAKAKALLPVAAAPSTAQFGLPLRLNEPKLRGDGPPVRLARSLANIDLPGVTPERTCSRCTKKANRYVEWEYWHRGSWRRAKRHLCGKHADRLVTKLNKTQP